MELTAEQLQFYATYGYILLPQWLAPIVSNLEDELEAGLAAQYEDTPIGSQWMWSRAAATPRRLTPTLAALMENPLILRPAQQILGNDCLGLGVDIQRYVGDVDYHPDGRGPTPDWGLTAAKFMVYLDSITASSGALHIVPGSHLIANEKRETFAQGIAASAFHEVPATALETTPGDLIIFNIHCWHGSNGGGVNRRVINIDMFANPTNATAMTSMADLGAAHAAGRDAPVLRRFPWNYSLEWMSGGSAERARWIERLRECGDYFSGEHVVEGGPVSVAPVERPGAKARREHAQRAAAMIPSGDSKL